MTDKIRNNLIKKVGWVVWLTCLWSTMSNASQIQKQQIERLIKDLQNQSPEIRLAAAETLGEIGAETAVPILHQLLESESKEVRVNTILALGAFSAGGTPNIVPTLIGILQDPSQDEDICRSTTVTTEIEFNSDKP